VSFFRHLKDRTNSDIQHVRAATFEIRDEHLAVLAAEGTLAALFLFSIVESWNATPASRALSFKALPSREINF
jgi:hypothetical protein